MKKLELRVGDVVELRNGNFRRIGENGRIETLKGGLVNFLSYYQDNLLYKDSTGSDGLDIIFVYRLFQTRKDEILTEKEKNYIYNLIKPFLNEVVRIVKNNYFDREEFISITIKDDMDITLPNFEKGKYYKNMKLEKNYSLEELGLIDYKKEK